MSKPAGPYVTQAKMRQAGPAAQLRFAGAWAAILAFCALAWGITLSLLL